MSDNPSDAQDYRYIDNAGTDSGSSTDDSDIIYEKIMDLDMATRIDDLEVTSDSDKEPLTYFQGKPIPIKFKAKIIDDRDKNKKH